MKHKRGRKAQEKVSAVKLKHAGARLEAAGATAELVAFFRDPAVLGQRYE